MKLKIKKGDKVVIVSGKYRKKQGVVERALPEQGKLVVAGVNIVKKHTRQSGQQKPGGIIKIAKPIDISKVKLICPNCQSPTRVGYEVKGEDKFRICKKCGGMIK